MQNNEFNALKVHNGQYIKAKLKMCGDKVYTNFWGVNVPEDGVESESFAIISWLFRKSFR